MEDQLRISVAQITSGDRHEGNIRLLEGAVARAVDDGADMLALPEVAGLMVQSAKEARPFVTDSVSDPYFNAAKRLAREAGIWILPGSTPVSGAGDKFLNRLILIDAEGRERAAYDKIHLFDAYLDGEKKIGESRTYDAGDEAVLCDTPWGPVGLTICYDVRFPQLFRLYGQAGARLVFVPAAFTVPTGRAHWETLLRARAIENGFYVVAPAQVGTHPGDRQSWGHSLIVSPWGEVLADLGGDGPAQTTLTLDLTQVERTRRQLPSLDHDRPFKLGRQGRS